MWKAFLYSMALFAAFPATTNYQLNSYGFGSGGVANSGTSTYSLEGSSGDLSTTNATNGTTSTKTGFVQTEQANVPKLQSLDNNGGLYYNRLHFVIDKQGNPTDAKYLIAVSTDNFASNSSYLQPDGTLSATLSLSDYQTYSSWGGSSGSLIIGLNPSTTYSVRLKATQGKYTESAYGPSTSQATAGSASIVFGLVTSNQSTPPLSIGMGLLDAGSIVTSAQTINTSLTTIGTTGGEIYVRSSNGGLRSASTNYKITSASADLGAASEGYGGQSAGTSQSSGGPLTVSTPYNGTSGSVGIIDSTLRTVIL